MAKNDKQNINIATPDEVDEFAPSDEASQEQSQTATDEQDPTAKAEGEVAALSDKLLRTQAELQNVMKRAEQRVSEAVRYANADLIKSLLDTIDDFDRTLSHTDAADVESVRKGVQLVYDKFMKVLTDNRVESIEPADEPFDPHYHEALMQQPAPNKPTNTVLQVVQRGFKLHDRVLRPAKVIVSAGGESSDASEE